MSEVVQMTTDRGVALLTLNRPQRLNAWTTEMEHAYFGLLDECAASEEVRVIVVTGAGRGFCAGADMHELQELSEGNTSRERRTEARRPQTFPLSVPKPVIAAINGPCAGIGLVQALMCDIRFAAVGAKLTLEIGGQKLVRTVKGGGSYLSASDRRVVFGLGAQQQPGRLTVRWPSGKVQTWEDLALDRYWQLLEGEPRAQEPRRWPTLATLRCTLRPRA